MASMRARANYLVKLVKRRPVYRCIAAIGCLSLLLLAVAPRPPRLWAGRGAWVSDSAYASGSWPRCEAGPGDSVVARVNASLAPSLPYAPFGYKLDDEATGRGLMQRWATVRAGLVELLATWHEQDDGLDTDVAVTVTRPFRMMEWGAQHGYLSSALLYTLPNTRVLSVDAEGNLAGSGALSDYKRRLQLPPFEDHHRDRALLCKSSLTPEAIRHLAPHGALCPAPGSTAQAVRAAAHVQLSLAALTLRDLPSGLRALARHVRAARATVLQLPEASARNASESLVATVQRAMDEHLCDVEGAAPCLLRADVRLLASESTAGPAPSTARPTMLVTLHCAQPAAYALPQVEEASEAACMNWLEASGCAHRLQHGSCSAGPALF